MQQADAVSGHLEFLQVGRRKRLARQDVGDGGLVERGLDGAGFLRPQVVSDQDQGLVAVADAAHLDRTPGVIMGYNAGNGPSPKQNPISGREWGWYNYDVYAYEGEMFVEEGKAYQFWGRFDDGEAIVIDGKLVVHQGNASGYNANPVVATSYTATKTGWVPFNAWIWDWEGGKTVMYCRFALQYNPSGTASTSYEDANVWQEIVDPGDMSLLRVAGTNAYTTVTAVTALI